MGIVQRRMFVRNRSTVLTRVIVGLFFMDEKPTISADKRTKYRHTLELSQLGSRLVTDLALLITQSDANEAADQVRQAIIGAKVGATNAIVK